LTKEQVARALNVICHQWLRHKCGEGATKQVARIIRYHQARNAAAMKSRGKPDPVQCIAL
jgi:hypothetical protein